MAHSTPAFEDLIAEGKIRTRPTSVYSTPTVLDINFDALAINLKAIVTEIYTSDPDMIQAYPGDYTEVIDEIAQDCNALIDFALLGCYNRLRTIAEIYSISTRTSRINPRAPVSNRLEYPVFISSLLSSIGPLRVPDSAHDCLIIYATTSANMNNYGRTERPDPPEGNYSRLIHHLRSCQYPLAPIDFTNLIGSAWTTAVVESTKDGLLRVVGTIHRTHYQPMDVPRAIFCYNYATNADNNIFPDLSITADLVNATEVTTAVAALARPTHVPESQTATSATRPAGIQLPANYFGMIPAKGQSGSSPAVPASVWILGRGKARLFTSYLAERLTKFDVKKLSRSFLTHKGALNQPATGLLP